MCQSDHIGLARAGERRMRNPHESAKPVCSYSSNILEPGVIYEVEASELKKCVDGGFIFENEDWSTDLSFGNVSTKEQGREDTFKNL